MRVSATDSFRNMRRGLLALAIVFPALYLALATVAIVQNRDSALKQAQSNVANIAATLNEHASRTVGEADSRLLAVIADIERRGFALAGPDEFELHHLLKWQSRQLPQAITLYVADPQGRVRVAGTNYPQRVLDISNRDYFQHHLRHADPDLYISHPVKSRANGKWAITLSRRLSHPDGSLNMVIAIALDLEYFNRFYSTLRMGEHGRLLLLRHDGTILMESPLTERVMQRNIAQSRVFELFRQAPAGAFRTERSAIDGTARIVGYASASQFALLSSASISQDQVLQPWRRLIVQSITIGAISIALLLGLTALLWRRLNELERTQASLAQQNDALAHMEKRYQELVDGIDGIIWEAEFPSCRFRYVSGSAAAVSGYPAEVWIATPDFWHTTFMPEGDGQAAQAIDALNSHTAVLQPITHRMRKPDGHEIELRSNIMVAEVSGSQVLLRGITVHLARAQS